MVIHTLIQPHCQVFTHILLHVFSHFHSFTIFLHLLYSIKDRTPPALGHASSPHAGNIDELSNIIEDITNMIDPDNDNRTGNAHVTPWNAGIEEVLPHRLITLFCGVQTLTYQPLYHLLTPFLCHIGSDGVWFWPQIEPSRTHADEPVQSVHADIGNVCHNNEVVAQVIPLLSSITNFVKLFIILVPCIHLQHHSVPDHCHVTYRTKHHCRMIVTTPFLKPATMDLNKMSYFRTMRTALS
jgi:hypothetical protein